MYHILKNLPIKRKLTLAFGTVILFCIVAALIGALGIGTVFSQSRVLYMDFGKSQGTVNRMLADFKQNELLTNTLLVNTSSAGAETLLDALSANKASLLESFTTSDESGYLNYLTAQEIRELETLLEAYFATQTDVVALVSSGETEQAIRLFTQDLMVTGEQVDEMIQQVITSQTQAGEQMLNQLGATTAEVMIALAVFALLSFVYSLIVTIKMSASISKSAQGLLDGMEGLRLGALNTRVPVLSQDDFGQISQKFNETCQTLEVYVSHVNQTMEQIAQGRLVYEDTVVFQGDFLIMQQSIIQMIQQENQLIRLVQSTAQQVSTAAGHVSASAQMLAQSSTEQAGSLEEIASSITDFSHRMQSAVADAASTSQKAEQAGALTKATNDKMAQMLEAMESIQTASEQMGGIVQSI